MKNKYLLSICQNVEDFDLIKTKLMNLSKHTDKLTVYVKADDSKVLEFLDELLTLSKESVFVLKAYQLNNDETVSYNTRVYNRDEWLIKEVDGVLMFTTERSNKDRIYYSLCNRYSKSIEVIQSDD